LEAYYLHKDPAIALAAIRKYEVYWGGRGPAPATVLEIILQAPKRGRAKASATAAAAIHQGPRQRGRSPLGRRRWAPGR
jgi:hypothetical protein